MKAIVAGVGSVGRNVARQFATRGELEQVIACDSDPEKLKSLAGIERLQTTTDYHAALKDPKVGLVYVITPNHTHGALVRAAFEHGKAVMCEKPIATTLAEARAVVELAERKKLFFQVGFELRYSLLYVKVKEWIDAGLLGHVVNTQCNYVCNEFHGKGSWRNKTDTGGSMFGEKLSHYVDLPRWWIGSEVVDVHSMCAPNLVPYMEVHDNYHTTYRFANGSVSHLSFCMYLAETDSDDPLRAQSVETRDDGHELRYQVIGTRGAVETDVYRRRIRRWEFGDSPKCFTSRLVETQTWKPEDDSAYYHDIGAQNVDICKRVMAGRPPATPARDAYETMRLVFAAEESANSGRIVELKEMP